MVVAHSTTDTFGIWGWRWGVVKKKAGSWILRTRARRPTGSMPSVVADRTPLLVLAADAARAPLAPPQFRKIHQHPAWSSHPQLRIDFAGTPRSLKMHHLLRSKKPRGRKSFSFYPAWKRNRFALFFNWGNSTKF